MDVSASRGCVDKIVGLDEVLDKDHMPHQIERSFGRGCRMVLTTRAAMVRGLIDELRRSCESERIVTVNGGVLSMQRRRDS